MGGGVAIKKNIFGTFFKFVEKVPTAIKLKGGGALIEITLRFFLLLFLQLPLLDKDFPRNLAS